MKTANHDTRRFKRKLALGIMATLPLAIVAATQTIDAADILDPERYLDLLTTEAARHEPADEELPKPGAAQPGLVLKAPSLDIEKLKPAVPAPSVPVTDGKRFARSYHFNGHILERPSEKARVLGVVRPGTRILAHSGLSGTGSGRGRWYPVEPTGYVQTGNGFNVTRQPSRSPGSFVKPDVTRPLPYRYAEVVNAGAPRFERIPNALEEELARRAMKDDVKPPDVVSEMMDGIYFIAIAGLEREGNRSFYRTVRGKYVRSDDVEVYPTYPMRGEKLGGDWRLPLAFVYEENRQLFRRIDGDLRKVGKAEKHARFVVDKSFTYDGKRYVRSTSGLVMPRNSVRVVRRIHRPEGVPADTKWIHIDLSKQTLLAYDSRKPVYATLLSSGKEGYDTPRGLFRIHHKYLTVTMSGDDPIEGYYEVEEVPWTMYYWRSYAVHGAYWHNDFGKVRSHGCTNIPPIDARWLYYWSEPRVPENWHAIRRQDGTWIYFTREKKATS